MIKSIFDNNSIYDKYRVTIALTGKLAGGVPKNPDIIRSWVEATTGYSDEQSEAITKETIDAVVTKEAENSWCGFKGDDSGLYIEARQVKALFKECASLLRITVNKRGSKQIFQHAFEVKPERLHLGKAEPDGYDEGPIHAQTPKGPITAIHRTDYTQGVTLTFEVWVMATHAAEDRHVGESDLLRMLELGQENGLGAKRSQGYGKFRVTAFERIETVPVKAKVAPEKGGKKKTQPIAAE